MNEKNVKWDKVFYGKSWINHVVDTIRTKDILQVFISNVIYFAPSWLDLY